MGTKDLREWFWGKNKNSTNSLIYNKIEKVIAIKVKKTGKKTKRYIWIATKKGEETPLVHEEKIK